MPRSSPFSTVLLFAVLALWGWSLWPKLPMQYLPQSQAPGLRVSYSWPYASPEAVEARLSSPLEGVFSLVPGVERLYSVSGQGSGYIDISPSKKMRRDELRFELATRIRQLYPHWPAGASYPRIEVQAEEGAAGQQPLLTYSLSGTGQAAELYRYAQEILAPSLALMPGFSQIVAAGSSPLEWQLQYDGERLRRLGLSPAELGQAIREAFGQQAIGMVAETGAWRFVSVASAFDRALPGSEAWASLPVGKSNGRLVRLSELGRVQLAESRPTAYFRINGQNSIRLLLYAEAGVNTIALAAQARRHLEQQRAALPPTYQLLLEDDRSQALQQELGKIKQRALLSLSILLVFILAVYRSLRYLVLIVLSLAVNLGIAFIAYYALGIELHLYALAGITVSFGIVIDNTLVMAHHLGHRSKIPVFAALLAGAATTASALAILYFLPEQWRLNLFEFAAVLLINLMASLAVARWFIPALMEQMGLLRRPARPWQQHRAAWRWQQRYERLLTGLGRFRKTALLLTVLAFGLPVFWLPRQVEGWAWYNRSLGSEWYLENLRPKVDRWLGGSLRLFARYVFESSGYREPDETVLYINAAMPPGATIEQMDAVCRQMESYLAQFGSAIQQFTTQVGSGQFGAIQVRFPPDRQAYFPLVLKERLIAYGLSMGGVQWNVYGVGRGFSNETGQSPPRFRVKMTAYHKRQLEQEAERFAARLAENPRVAEINTEANINWWEKDLYQYAAVLDQSALARIGGAPGELLPAMAAFNQAPAVSFYAAGYPLRMAETSRRGQELWQMLHQSQPLGERQADLGALARLEKVKTRTAIHKEDQQYIQLITFEYQGERRFGARHLDACLEITRQELPLGYTIEEAGYRSKAEQRKLYRLLPLVLGLIFFICAIHFESLRQAWLVLLLVPLSFIGIFLVFYGFGFRFDQGGYTSFILVSGLAVNSLILLLNDYNYYRKKHPRWAPMRLYARAYTNKIAPIALSVLSTVLGMIPFLLQGDAEVFWFALAAGTMGGLSFSLVVLTLLTPLFLRQR
jgi:multidrug efflux pump subunit AcrB